MTAVSGPVLLIALQALNAWFFATVAGPGLTLFQDMIARPGVASGLYMNTRRVGSHRVRRDHQLRLGDRARIRRGVRGLRRAQALALVARWR